MNLFRFNVSDILKKSCEADCASNSVWSGDVTQDFVDTISRFDTISEKCCKESFKYEPEIVPIFAQDIGGVNEGYEPEEYEYYVELDNVAKLAKSKECKIHEAFFMMQNYVASQLGESAAEKTYLIVSGIDEAKEIVKEAECARGSLLEDSKLQSIMETTEILKDLYNRGVQIKIRDSKSED